MVQCWCCVGAVGGGVGGEGAIARVGDMQPSTVVLWGRGMGVGAPSFDIGGSAVVRTTIICFISHDGQSM